MALVAVSSQSRLTVLLGIQGRSKNSKSRFDGQVMIVDKYSAKEGLQVALYSSGPPGFDS